MLEEAACTIAEIDSESRIVGRALRADDRQIRVAVPVEVSLPDPTSVERYAEGVAVGKAAGSVPEQHRDVAIALEGWDRQIQVRVDATVEMTDDDVFWCRAGELVEDPGLEVDAAQASRSARCQQHGGWQK